RGCQLELWRDDGEDAAGEDQEERVLRLWLNSLAPGSLHVASLFDREVATGWPLLLALDAIQPGCVSWHNAFRPPFKEKLRKILSVQNCNLVIQLCTHRLAMPPLVNIGGLDLALGQRRATLSLVFQMMRHHTGMMLGLVAPLQQPSGGQQHPQQQQQPSCARGGCHSSPAHHSQHPHHPHHPRQHVEVEKAVLAWANAKLTEAAAAAYSATSSASPTAPSTAPSCFPPLASFSDPRLAAGAVLLRLLAAIRPRAVKPQFVLPGRTAEERESNAKYLLSCARKVGCVIFLVWEDVVAARPNLLLLLLASFMALDRKQQQQQGAEAAGDGAGAATGAASGAPSVSAAALAAPLAKGAGL
ncbi:hypothetical protein Agub_g9699, partial [Astrephomene gubernaculifera]